MTRPAAASWRAPRHGETQGRPCNWRTAVPNKTGSRTATNCRPSAQRRKVGCWGTRGRTSKSKPPCCNASCARPHVRLWARNSPDDSTRRRAARQVRTERSRARANVATLVSTLDTLQQLATAEGRALPPAQARLVHTLAQEVSCLPPSTSAHFPWAWRLLTEPGGYIPEMCGGNCALARRHETTARDSAAGWRTYLGWGRYSSLPAFERGLRILGTPHGTPEYVAAQLESLSPQHGALFARLPNVRDLQVAWLLLFFCAMPRALYVLRMLPPHWTSGVTGPVCRSDVGNVH